MKTIYLILANIIDLMIKKNKLILIIKFSKSFQKNKLVNNKKVTYIYKKIDETLKGLKSENYCLIRSSMAYLMLSLHGYNSDLIIGITLDPFYSHAWIEIDSIPQYETLDIKIYDKIITIH